MLVKVAVIGPEAIVNKVLEQGVSFNELELISVPYVSETEAIQQSIETDEKVDIILYTGPVPYVLAGQMKDTLSSHLMYINYSGSSLYKVLFQMLRDGILHQEHQNRVSLDFLNHDEVISTFQEIEIDYSKVKILEHALEMSSSSIADFHYDLWKRGEVEVSVTCLYSVYLSLQSRGIPTYCIIPTVSSIQAALERILDWGRNKIMENNQIAVCIVALEDPEEKKMIEILSGYLQASGQKCEPNSYVFYTTKGLVHTLTQGFKNLPHFMIDSCATMGVGIGQTANEALLRSQSALAKGEKDGKNVLYIVGDVNTVIKLSQVTPFKRLEYDSRSYDETTLRAATKTNLSVSTLSKIHYIAKASGKEDITSQELASQLNITLRSARRILKALADEGYAEIVGEEQPIERGRPRQIYRLIFEYFY